MVIVKTVEDFKKHNEDRLKNFMRFKTGIFNEEEINDVIQDFYIKLIESKALETFDEKKVIYGSRETVFKVYIINLFCWLLSYIKKKRNRQSINSISCVKSKDKSLDLDVFELVTAKPFLSEYTIHPKFSYSMQNINNESSMDYELEDFIKYIRKTEKKKKAEKMVHFLQHRIQGCKAVDIAKTLKVSSNMVKFIKNDTYRSYMRYKEGWKTTEKNTKKQ